MTNHFRRKRFKIQVELRRHVIGLAVWVPWRLAAFPLIYYFWWKESDGKWRKVP